ncbi:glycosyltransferase [Geofilum rubicundum]|uniref:Hemolytic protein hlpA n=1 Tax=Geofilum rubicundum JCM 15548 TaxID=1236989 RepID=A0A0E9LWQ0_9BACT|nr:glycosyltransferase [Geofilum rubicundum]GAO29733.1 Hemolytic protein hlpA [Geofilum rubicundum JCM 15548]
MYYPVVLFCYNRPDHVQKTLSALSANEGALDTPLIVFSDGPATTRDVALVKSVRRLLSIVQGFKSVRIVCSEGNKGLSASVIDGVSEVLSTFDACLVLEDDLETAPYFLKFMNEALWQYKNDGHIFSVSGYCPPIAIPKDYSLDSFLFPRINSWGWGTWRDRWEKVDWSVADFQPFISNKAMREQLAEQGADLPVMLLKQQQGKIASWAVRFNQACFNLGMTNVYPVQSLVSNRGADGSGTHMKHSGKYAVALCHKYLSSKRRAIVPS